MKDFESDQNIYDNVDALDPEPDMYTPDSLPEREDELSTIHSALRPITMEGSPRNLLVYGPTGQGKTVAVDIKTNQLQEWAQNEEGVSLTVLWASCKGAGKSWNVLADLVQAARKERRGPGASKPRGRTKIELFELLTQELEKIGGTILIVLDEIDGITEDNYILYELPRADVPGIQLGVIGITNDLQFRDGLDTDVQSSLASREVVFSPYDANQLRNILSRRAVHALQNTSFEGGIQNSSHLRSEVLSNEVVPYCAAKAGQNTGDARQAIRLLSTACDRALDNRETKVSKEHVEQAEEELWAKTVGKEIIGETIQRKLALLTVLEAEVYGETPESTTELYQRYDRFTTAIDAETYSRATFRKKLNDLSHGNILNGDRRGRGRGKGMTNQYGLAIDQEIVIEKLREDSRLEPLFDIIL
jgi:cell division control protein 6